MLLILLACAKPVPPPTLGAAIPTLELRPKECTAILGIGEQRRGEGDVESARWTWTEGYNRCGPGYGFLGRLATLDSEDAPDEAVKLAVRELREPGPFGATVHFVTQTWSRVTPSTQSEVRALGGDATAPLFMPDLGAALAWSKSIVCDGEAEVTVTPGNGPFRVDAACRGTVLSRWFVMREVPVLIAPMAMPVVPPSVPEAAPTAP